MTRYSEKYVNKLIDSDCFESLVDLQSICTSWCGFDHNKSDYGLLPFAFAFVEALTWFSQSIRSGSWTYYESTPEARQRAMLNSLRELGLSELAEKYSQGIMCWASSGSLKDLDQWIDGNEILCNSLLRKIVKSNKNVFYAKYA